MAGIQPAGAECRSPCHAETAAQNSSGLLSLTPRTAEFSISVWTHGTWRSSAPPSLLDHTIGKLNARLSGTRRDSRHAHPRWVRDFLPCRNIPSGASSADAAKCVSPWQCRTLSQFAPWKRQNLCCITLLGSGSRVLQQGPDLLSCPGELPATNHCRILPLSWESLLGRCQADKHRWAVGVQERKVQGVSDRTGLRPGPKRQELVHKGDSGAPLIPDPTGAPT